jgi:hypothetical protein
VTLMDCQPAIGCLMDKKKKKKKKKKPPLRK